MRLTKLSRSSRLFLGVLAAGLGLGATATQVIQVAAEPATGDSSDSFSPASLPAPGTYESCSGLFGLFKQNSDLVSFDIVQGANPVTTLPTMGTDIIPIVTLSDGTTSVSCEAVSGWTNESEFSTYLNDAQITGTSMTYPGIGYFLVPAIDGSTFNVNGGSFLPTTRSVEYLTNLDVDETLLADPIELAALASKYGPYGDLPANSAELADPFFARVYTAVLNSPIGSQAQVDYLSQQLILLVDGQSTTCSDQDPTMLALGATMRTLSTGFNSGWVGPLDCSGLLEGTNAIGRIQLFNAEVSETGITLTVSGPAPPTTTSSTTTTTLTSTTVAADPLVPAFTG
jgi:hypothetical protein